MIDMFPTKVCQRIRVKLSEADHEWFLRHVETLQKSMSAVIFYTLQSYRRGIKWDSRCEVMEIPELLQGDQVLPRSAHTQIRYSILIEVLLL